MKPGRNLRAYNTELRKQVLPMLAKGHTPDTYPPLYPSSPVAPPTPELLPPDWEETVLVRLPLLVVTLLLRLILRTVGGVCEWMDGCLDLTRAV